jgi:hypothetical protein
MFGCSLRALAVETKSFSENKEMVIICIFIHITSNFSHLTLKKQPKLTSLSRRMQIEALRNTRSPNISTKPKDLKGMSSTVALPNATKAKERDNTSGRTYHTLGVCLRRPYS